MEDQVILVDINDQEIGVAEKMAAHRQGWRHRAFSIFVLNSQGQLLLQKRAIAKYHSGGLWTNTCCSHPRPGESTIDAAYRRLQEEMGFSCPLVEIFSFTYRAELGDLIEHEFDHVFQGQFDGEPILNPSEAEDWQWIDLDDLKTAVQIQPHLYTYWLKVCLTKWLN